MTALSNAERQRLTVGQQERLAAERDCPHCSGTLKQTEIRAEDSHVDEFYRHVGGAGTSCPGHSPSNGLLSRSGTWVEHWRDKSVGVGALAGVFDG